MEQHTKRDSFANTTNTKDTTILLQMAQDIVKLDNIEVLNSFCGVRASSKDYLPIIGEIIDHKKTLKLYPYLKHGSKVPSKNHIKHKNLYILNGLGGRGFVLSPYLASYLVEYIINKKSIDDKITLDRLFLRWARKI